MRFGFQRHATESTVLLDRRIATAALVAMPAYALPEGDAPPTEFLMFSPGVNHTEKGDFDFNGEAAEAVMSFWGGKGVELSFDYEHQSLHTPPIEAPAAGWWRPEVRNGALYATAIRWTDKAAKYLTSREYRYFSPAFNFDESTGQILRIINCALTNNPAMNNIAPLIAASANTKETPMPCEACTTLSTQLAAAKAECAALTARLSSMDDTDKAECTAVGLSVGARPGERLVAVQAVAKLRADLRALTGADSDAAAMGAITAWKDSAGEVAKLKADHAKAEQVSLDAELATVIAAGVKDGKLAKAEAHPARVILLKQAVGADGKATKEGVAFLRSYLEVATPIVKTETAGQVSTDKDTGTVTLSVSEKANVARFGMNAEVATRAKARLIEMGVPVPSDAA